MKEQLGVALVGCGMVAPVFMAALKEIPEVQIRGVWSRSVEKAKTFAAKYSIGCYQSYEGLLADPGVHIAIVCTPPGFHVDCGLKAAAARKHLIVEKPIDVSLSKAQALIESCRKNRVKLSVIFQNRFTSGAKKMKKAIDEGMLGRLILGDGYVKWHRSPDYYASNAWRGTQAIEGGGALINQAIHTIDLLQWLMGGVKTVIGLTRTSIHHIETEDLGVAVVEFINGALGVIEGSTAIQPGFKERVEIHGQKGSIILEGGNIKEWKVEGCREEDYVDQQKVSYGSTHSPAISYANHKAQLEEIIDSIQNDKEPLVNGEEGLKSLEIVLGIYESSRKKGPVVIGAD
ncbi:MAG: Gfo/Idh/MocA family protein [Thermodesulfobacteriota bacterium]